MYHPWLLSCFNSRVEKLSQRSYALQSLKYLLSSPLQRKFASHCWELSCVGQLRLDLTCDYSLVLVFLLYSGSLTFVEGSPSTNHIYPTVCVHHLGCRHVINTCWMNECFPKLHGEDDRKWIKTWGRMLRKGWRGAQEERCPGEAAGMVSHPSRSDLASCTGDLVLGQELTHSCGWGSCFVLCWIKGNKWTKECFPRSAFNVSSGTQVLCTCSQYLALEVVVPVLFCLPETDHL